MKQTVTGHSLMLKFIFLFLLLFSSLVNAEEFNIQDIEFFTEENPPSNFVVNKQIIGIAPELLHLIWEELGFSSTPNIRIIPWARGYNYLQNSNKVVLFSTTRTPEREALGFKWAGPIKKNKIVLLARKDRNITINQLDDAKKYKIGTVYDDIGEHILLNSGFSKDNLHSVSSLDLSVRMLNHDRIDLIAKGYENLLSLLEKEGNNINAYEAVFTLSERHQYFAFNKDIPDKVVAQFQAAIDKLTDKHNAILEKYNASNL